ncbi:NAD-dependent epimerase/dehydratase family protein [Nocardioides currus]|uniref:NAD(P)-dependent oxidoreductase n=1 Tax=Nocardioides currus TaxID=2133958 RepID=A0A2R7YYR9_9ACTN|nr:NAD-dependent epimerase/dehydratase family protein [Nocardioides currus]PUA81528.1 NAD(P)-dependent oxidoreductase [Nocardioides currus]
MKVLISGGAGFIGQHLARALTGSGHEVVALDNLHPQVHLDPEGARAAFPGGVLVADVADEAAWSAIEGIDAVVHLAAETGTGQSMYEQDRYRRVNVEGTRLAGAFAAEHGITLVALSSRAVYGDGTPDRPSFEDDPHHPVSFYGETKSLGEAALEDAAQRVGITTIRPQNVIGPGQALHNPYTGVLAAFLAMLREGRPLTVYGDGTQTRDFIHVQDLAALIAWAVEHPAEPGAQRILNAGTGTRTTLLELAAYAIEGSPHDDVPIEHLDVHRAGDIDHACASLDRLTEVGAPMPEWTSREAVVDFIRWSWDKPGAASQAWDLALEELAQRGLTDGTGSAG